MNHSPESSSGWSSPEGPAADAEIERQRLLAELAGSRHESLSQAASAEIARNPELHLLLSRLIEGGPELSPTTRAHLKRMIAISYAFGQHIAEMARTEVDQQLHNMVAANIQTELDELDAMAGSDLTEEWDRAYQDLQRFYDPVTDAINEVTGTLQDPELPY